MGSIANESSNSKKVIDEVSGWLRVFDDGTVDRAWTGPPEPLFLMQPVHPYATPRDGITVHDIPTDVGPTVRIYLPEDSSGGERPQNNNLPVLLHFHGGGFCISHATWLMYHQFYSRLAVAIPAIVVSPFLPLAPERRLPAAADACYDALLWLKTICTCNSLSPRHPAIGRLRSSADFSRVFLIGDSSGGNLVHAVAARAGRAAAEDGGLGWAPLGIAGGVLLHPGFVRSGRSASEEMGREGDAFLTLDMLDKFLALALPVGSTKDHPVTCPMGEEAPDMGGLRVPPFLVAVAENDLIRDTNLEYCGAMRRAGKDVEVVVSGGVGHSFYLNKMAVDSEPVARERCRELILAIKDFVDRH